MKLEACGTPAKQISKCVREARHKQEVGSFSGWRVATSHRDGCRGRWETVGGQGHHFPFRQEMASSQQVLRCAGDGWDGGATVNNGAWLIGWINN